MKKFLGLFLSVSLMMSMFSTAVFAEENIVSKETGTEVKTEYPKEVVQPTQESVVSVTVDGNTIDYATLKDALERKITGNEIVVKLNQDVDFTNEGVYSKKTQTNGIYLEIGTEGANVVFGLKWT